MAQQLFGVGVKELDKMQASQLIEELLEKTGKKTNGRSVRWQAVNPHGHERARIISRSSRTGTHGAGNHRPFAEDGVGLAADAVPAMPAEVLVPLRRRDRESRRRPRSMSAAPFMRCSRHGTRRAGKAQPLTLKQLHDEFSKAWADAGDRTRANGRPVKRTEEKTDRLAARGNLHPRVEHPGRTANPMRSKCRWKPTCIEHGLPTLIGVLDLCRPASSSTTRPAARRRTRRGSSTPTRCKPAATPCSIATPPANGKPASSCITWSN